MVVSIDPAKVKPWIGEPPRTAPPDVPGYAQIACEQLAMGPLTILGFLAIPVWWAIFALSVAALGGENQTSGSIDLTFTFSLIGIPLALFIALIAVPLLHEFVHGVVAKTLGARPAYGIGPGFAYTTFQEPMGRASYLTVGLAPLVVLSIASVVLAARWDAGAGWLIFFAVVNAAGAVGDLWMAWRILRQPRRAIFFDLADGFAVLVPSR